MPPSLVLFVLPCARRQEFFFPSLSPSLAVFPLRRRCLPSISSPEAVAGQLDLTTSFTQPHSTSLAPMSSLSPSLTSYHRVAIAAMPFSHHWPLLMHHRPSRAPTCIPCTPYMLPVPKNPTLSHLSVVSDLGRCLSQLWRAIGHVWTTARQRYAPHQLRHAMPITLISRPILRPGDADGELYGEPTPRTS